MRESRYAKQDTQKKARKRTMIDLTPIINAEIEAVIESLVLGLKG